FPDAVDHDAGGQRVLRVGDPVGQEFSPASAMIFRNLLSAENGQKTARDFIAQILRIAFALYARVGRGPLDDGISLGDLDVTRVQFRLAQPDVRPFGLDLVGHSLGVLRLLVVDDVAVVIGRDALAIFPRLGFGFLGGGGFVFTFRLGRFWFLAGRRGRFGVRRRGFFHFLVSGRDAALGLQPFDRVINLTQLLLLLVKILGLLAAD